jgi:hypothetical protein
MHSFKMTIYMFVYDVLFSLQFNNLFKLPEKHSSWSGNNEIFCEDSNSGLLDHNLQLLDSEILQSPTKLGLFSEVIGIVELRIDVNKIKLYSICFNC